MDDFQARLRVLSTTFTDAVAALCVETAAAPFGAWLPPISAPRARGQALGRAVDDLALDQAGTASPLERRDLDGGALTALRRSLTSKGAPGEPESKSKRNRPVGQPPPKQSGPIASATGQKRDPVVIQAVQDRVLAWLRDNPGSGVEAVNVALGTATKDVTLPLRKLVAAGVLRAEGEKRATKYTVVGGKK